MAQLSIRINRAMVIHSQGRDSVYLEATLEEPWGEAEAVLLPVVVQTKQGEGLRWCRELLESLETTLVDRIPIGYRGAGEELVMERDAWKERAEKAERALEGKPVRPWPWVRWRA